MIVCLFLQILNTEINLKFQQPTLLEVPKFKTALEYRDRFTFGIDKLDSKLQLHDDMIGIFGETRYTNTLATGWSFGHYYHAIMVVLMWKM